MRRHVESRVAQSRRICGSRRNRRVTSMVVTWATRGRSITLAPTVPVWRAVQRRPRCRARPAPSRGRRTTVAAKDRHAAEPVRVDLARLGWSSTRPARPSEEAPRGRSAAGIPPPTETRSPAGRAEVVLDQLLASSHLVLGLRLGRPRQVGVPCVWEPTVTSPVPTASRSCGHVSGMPGRRVAIRDQTGREVQRAPAPGASPAAGGGR